MPIYIAGVYDVTRMAIYSTGNNRKGGGEKIGQNYYPWPMTEKCTKVVIQ